VAKGVDDSGTDSGMPAPARACDGSSDFLLSEPGRSPVLDVAQLEVLRRYGASVMSLSATCCSLMGTRPMT
jgi:hypothetical protein